MLLAALFAGSQQYTKIWREVWVGFTIGVAALSTWWLIDLHNFAQSTREASEKLASAIPERDHYLPKRGKDQHHRRLLLAKIAVVAIAAVLTVIEIVLRP